MASTRAFEALGFSFAVEAEDRPLLAYVGDLFRSFSEPAAGARHRFTFRSDAPEQPGHELRFDDVSVAVLDACEELLPYLVHRVNREAIERSDLLLLHAGGVEHDGVGLVLPGMMESGKSTLVTGLVRAGLGYLTDEAVALHRETLVVEPYAKPISLDPGSWNLFPELEPHADLLSDGYKSLQWQVPVDAIRPHAVGHACPVGTIVFPRFEAGSRTILEPVRRAEALVELATCTFHFNEDGRGTLDALGDVVRGAECYRLLMGDLEHAVELVAIAVGADVVEQAAP